MNNIPPRPDMRGWSPSQIDAYMRAEAQAIVSQQQGMAMPPQQYMNQQPYMNQPAPGYSGAMNPMVPSNTYPKTSFDFNSSIGSNQTPYSPNVVAREDRVINQKDPEIERFFSIPRDTNGGFMDPANKDLSNHILNTVLNFLKSGARSGLSEQFRVAALQDSYWLTLLGDLVSGSIQLEHDSLYTMDFQNQDTNQPLAIIHSLTERAFIWISSYWLKINNKIGVENHSIINGIESNIRNFANMSHNIVEYRASLRGSSRPVFNQGESSLEGLYDFNKQGSQDTFQEQPEVEEDPSKGEEMKSQYEVSFKQHMEGVLVDREEHKKSLGLFMREYPTSEEVLEKKEEALEDPKPLGTPFTVGKISTTMTDEYNPATGLGDFLADIETNNKAGKALGKLSTACHIYPINEPSKPKLITMIKNIDKICLDKLGTLVDIQEEIQATLESIPKSHKSSLTYLSEFTDMLTNVVNDTLKDILITSTDIDSFLTDAEDLKVYLEAKGNLKHWEIITEVIKSLLIKQYDKDDSIEDVGGVLGIKADELLFVENFGNIAVNARAVDLHIESISNDPVALSSEYNKYIVEAFHAVIADTQKDLPNRLFVYLCTVDWKIFKMHESAYQEGTVVIRRVK